MPEPQEIEKTEDVYSRDVEDPYAVSETKATALEKLRFLAEPVCYALFLGKALPVLFYGITLNTNGHYWMVTGLSWHACNVYMGASSNMAVALLSRPLGYAPHAFSFRTYLTCHIFVNHCTNMHAGRFTWVSMMHEYTNGIEWDEPNDNVGAIGLGLFCMIFMYSNWGPLAYKDYSTFGTYCCANSTQVRVMKNTMLELFAYWSNVFVCRFYYLLVALSGAAGLLLMLLVFAWKRFQYALNVTTVAHDTAWKGHSVIMYVWAAVAYYNVNMTIGALGAPSWESTGSFLATDWGIFALRIIIVARMGMKSCPKLITYLVIKQLENLPSPLPNHVKAVGQKTAMRTFQAYMCMVEGEALTTVYFLQVLFFIWAIAFSWLLPEYIVLICPLKTIGVPLMFMGFDFLQDGLADRVCHKFSNFTFVYRNTGNDGWTCRRNTPFRILAGVMVGHCFTMYIALKGAVVLSGFIRAAHPHEWFSSGPNLMHY